MRALLGRLHPQPLRLRTASSYVVGSVRPPRIVTLVVNPATVLASDRFTSTAPFCDRGALVVDAAAYAEFATASGKVTIAQV